MKIALDKPNNWLRLECLGLVWLLFRPQRGQAMLRLSRRWRWLAWVEFHMGIAQQRL